MTMGLIRRALKLFERPSVTPGDAEYQCLRCGAEYERNLHTCSQCDAPFVAPVDVE